MYKNQYRNFAGFFTECEINNNKIPKIHNDTKKTLLWWTHELDELKKGMKRKRRRIRNASEIRRQHVIDEYLQAKEKYRLELSKVLAKQELLS